MTIQYQNKQLSTKLLGSVKINKIMLGVTEVFPRVVPPIITSVPGGAPVFTQYQAIEPFQFSTIGGVPPYVYTTVAGALPSGITMSTGGYFEGTPQVAGPFNVTFRTTDSQQRFSDQEYSGHVVEAGGVWTPYDLFSPTDTGGWWDLDDGADAKLAWVATRRNLLLWSEDLSNAFWVKTGVTATFLGSSTRLTPTAVDAIHDTYNNGAGTGVVATQTYTITARVATDGLNFAGIKGPGYNSPASIPWATVDLTTGAVQKNSSALAAGATFLGNGVWELVMTWVASYTISANSNSGCGVTGLLTGTPPTANVTQVTFLGDGNSGILVSGMQFESGTGTPYQKITDWNTEFLAQFPDTVLYQDAAGTTPVTALEQPIGLILDKSKGLVLGVNTPPTGTVIGGYTTLALSESDITFACSGYANGSTTPNFVTGLKTYKVTGSLVLTSGNIALALGTAGNSFSNRVTLTTSGPFTMYLASTYNGAIAFNLQSTQASSGVLTISEVQELPGNHLSQPTAGARPKWTQDPTTLAYGAQGDGIDDGYPSSAFSMMGATGMTSYGGLRQDSTAGYQALMNADDNTTRVAQIFRSSGGSINTISFGGGNAFTDSTGITLVSGNYYVLRQDTTTTSVELLINDATDGPTALTGALNTTPTLLQISGNGGRVNGLICQMIIINRPLTTDENQKTTNFINTEMGVTP